MSGPLWLPTRERYRFARSSILNPEIPGRTRLAIHPSRFGYATGGLALVLDVIIVSLIPRTVHGSSEAAIAAIVVGGVALYGLNEVLLAAVAEIVVDDDGLEVRNQLGRRRRFAREDVGHAERRSVFAPAQSGIYQDEVLLIAKDGRCIARMWERDYSSVDLERLVKTLGLEWPKTVRSSLARINRTFPGAHRFDYQIATVVILVIFAGGLAVVAFAMLTH